MCRNLVKCCGLEYRDGHGNIKTQDRETGCEDDKQMELVCALCPVAGLTLAALSPHILD
jgi:major membrane immunogen (membrane-anchored lipoprotein)